jgi:two-component system alkaline phosphatase synthesis response regulator PhoP
MPATALATGPDVQTLRCANLELPAGGGAPVLVDGEPIELTARERQVLAALVARRDRVVPRGDLYVAVWRQRMAYRDRSVDVFVRKLRLKLKSAAPAWVYIHTHFGVGYRFSPQPAPTADAEGAPGAQSRGVGTVGSEIRR